MEELKSGDDRVWYGHMTEWWSHHISSPLKVLYRAEEERHKEDRGRGGYRGSATIQGQCTIEII